MVSKNISKRLDRTGTLCALRPRLDRVERLRGICGDGPGNCPICKVGHCILINVLALLEVFEDVISPHAESGSACLLERCASVTVVESEKAVLLVDYLDGMEGGFDLLAGTSVVDQCCL